MRHSPVASGHLSVAERTSAAERIIAFLRRLYPVKTAENVAADIGGSAETIQKMMDRMTTPNALTYGRLVCAYGPAFLCAALESPPAWVSAAARDEQIRALRAEQERITKQLRALEPAI